MTATALKLAPGLFRRGTIDYASIDAVNFSTLKYMQKSPLHYRHALESPRTATTPMRLGTAAHTAVLEPARFITDYAVFEPEEGKAPRRGTKAWDTFAAANDGKELLKQPEFNAAMRIRDAVRGNVEAMRYLRKGDAEVTLVWQDKETGLWLKGRVDFISQSVPDVIADLKTARDVSPWAFQSAYAKMQYHMQAAMYADGLEAILGRPTYHKCIAVESAEPHDTVVYDVIGEPLELGREVYRDLLHKLVECRKNNEWPGASAGAEVSLRLPAWAVPDESDDLGDLGLEQ
jgi:exodeoxyribonuclease VIII